MDHIDVNLSVRVISKQVMSVFQVLLLQEALVVQVEADGVVDGKHKGTELLLLPIVPHIFRLLKYEPYLRLAIILLNRKV